MESGGGIDLPTVSSAQKFHTEFVSALNCSVTDVCVSRSALVDTPSNLLLYRSTVSGPELLLN